MCAQDRVAPRCTWAAVYAEPWRLGRSAGHWRTAKRRSRAQLAFDQRRAAVGLWLPNCGASAQPRRGVRSAARTANSDLPWRITGSVAQREWRWKVEEVVQGVSEEGNLLHGVTRRAG